MSLFHHAVGIEIERCRVAYLFTLSEIVIIERANNVEAAVMLPKRRRSFHFITTFLQVSAIGVEHVMKLEEFVTVGRPRNAEAAVILPVRTPSFNFLITLLGLLSRGDVHIY